jgi:hypothetical protein
VGNSASPNPLLLSPSFVSFLPSLARLRHLWVFSFQLRPWGSDDHDGYDMAQVRGGAAAAMSSQRSEHGFFHF